MPTMKVVQCWDDGVLNDIRLADLLRRYGAKATFNLNPGWMGDARGVDRWTNRSDRGWSHSGFIAGKLSLRDLPEIYDGFQVASHCWRHEVAGTVPDGQWIQSALEARHFLEDLFQRPCRGFAWPCGVDTPATIALLREQGFAYGRSTRYTWDVTRCPEPLALATNCHFQSNEFWARYEKAKETGVFYFWGHSYEMFHYDEMWDHFEEKIRFITGDPDAEWADVIDIVPLLQAP
ncbi:MAG: polysaccharide deacetylase family protein [Kiritimatiellia bacterium]|jgi:peptidoglycan/xylan/chitin deacetylase (PgdA/CDA1 family)